MTSNRTGYALIVGLLVCAICLGGCVDKDLQRHKKGLVRDTAGKIYGFKAQRTFHTGLDPEYVNQRGGMATGDIDGDGDKDIVVGGSHSEEAFYLFKLVNNGAGTFHKLPIGKVPGGLFSVSLVLEDIDTDGDLDLLFGAGAWDLHLFVYRNDGKGNFSPKEQLQLEAEVSG